MFTGIIEATGTVTDLTLPPNTAISGAGQLHLHTEMPTDDIPVGGSVAVSGVCLTLVAHRRDGFVADVVPETLQRTTLGRLQPGARVNLERSLPATGRLDGHLVQGHVDGTGHIRDHSIGPDHDLVQITLPDPLARYVAAKGSIAVDGISLTVVAVWDGPPAGFSVAVIPQTKTHTTLGEASRDTPVNLEIDVVAKYVDRLTTTADATEAMA